MAEYQESSRLLPMVCTLCWAKVDPRDRVKHTYWHEHVERVPGLLSGYPPSIEIPKQED